MPAGSILHSWPGPLRFPTGLAAGQAHQRINITGPGTLKSFCAGGVIPSVGTPARYPDAFVIAIEDADAANYIRICVDGLTTADATNKVGTQVSTESGGGTLFVIGPGLDINLFTVDSAGAHAQLFFMWIE